MIVCVGTTPVFQRSMVFDRLRPDEVNRAVSVHDYASGKAVNVARVLGTLGEDAFATGFAGGDRGAALVRDLDAAGIGNAFVTVEAPTRQCVTVIDRTARTATELVEESLPVRDEDWSRLAEQLDRLRPGASALVLSGSLPPGAPDDFYLTCLRRVAPAEMPVVLDTRGEPLRLALCHGGFVVKLNRDELSMTIGRRVRTDTEVIEAAREIMPQGGAAVVTLGAGGAIATDGRAAWRVGVPTVETRSAVGSGDAFSAGLVTGLLRREALPDACARGAACGAANAMTDLAGHLSPADVDTIRAQVSVTPL